MEDLQRYRDFRTSKVSVFFKSDGFKYTYWMRWCKYFRPINYIAFAFCKLFLNHYRFKYGIDIPYATKIGGSFKISHFGTIVFSGGSIIGENCTIYQGVTVGKLLRGNRKGSPTIGNNVCICAGAKVLGNVKIGDNALIGANAVVIKDIPANAVVGATPPKIISYKGSKDYLG